MCGPSGVGVVNLPREASAIASFLKASWALDEPRAAAARRREPTAEDRARTELYRQLDERKSFVSELVASQLTAKGSHMPGADRDDASTAVAGTAGAAAAAATASMDAFAASLNLRVEITPLDDERAARAAQLTERTNQHNACKWVASADGLLAIASASHLCLAAEASDRFGHHGLVGLIIADKAPVAQSLPAGSHQHSAGAGGEVSVGGGDESDAVLHVHCWLLSCRSLHLGIEHIMLRHLAALATTRGATHLGIHWRRSERNEPAAAFLFSMSGVRFRPVAVLPHAHLHAHDAPGPCSCT